MELHAANFLPQSIGSFGLTATRESGIKSEVEIERISMESYSSDECVKGRETNKLNSTKNHKIYYDSSQLRATKVTTKTNGITLFTCLNLIILLTTQNCQAQCPWQRESSELHADCICDFNPSQTLTKITTTSATTTGNQMLQDHPVNRMSVQCSPVDFELLLKALKQTASIELPSELLHANHNDISINEELLQSGIQLASQTKLDLLHVANSSINLLANDTFILETQLSSPNGLMEDRRLVVAIQSIHLSRCNLKSIDIDAFRGLEWSLASLSLSDNLLETIPVLAINRLYNLKVLDLSNNRIVRLEANSFARLNKLTALRLADNKIGTTTTTTTISNHLPPTTGGGANTVGQRAIDDQAFVGLEDSLTDLNLKNTQLDFYPKAISSLKNLAFLNLAQNQISKIPPRSFANMSSLTAINLERNRISLLDPNTFSGIESTLSSLSLLGNLLESFPTEQLAKLTSIRRLDLGFNGIELLPEDSFKHNKQLILVALDGNPLETLPELAFKPLEGTLRGLSVGGKALNCDCRLSWMLRWQIEYNLQISSRERQPQFCSKPQYLRSLVSFATLKPEHVTCVDGKQMTNAFSRPPYLLNHMSSSVTGGSFGSGASNFTSSSNWITRVAAGGEGVGNPTSGDSPHQSTVDAIPMTTRLLTMTPTVWSIMMPLSTTVEPAPELLRTTTQPDTKVDHTISTTTKAPSATTIMTPTTTLKPPELTTYNNNLILNGSNDLNESSSSSSKDGAETEATLRSDDLDLSFTTTTTASSDLIPTIGDGNTDADLGDEMETLATEPSVTMDLSPAPSTTQASVIIMRDGENSMGNSHDEDSFLVNGNSRKPLNRHGFSWPTQRSKPPVAGSTIPTIGVNDEEILRTQDTTTSISTQRSTQNHGHTLNDILRRHKNLANRTTNSSPPPKQENFALRQTGERATSGNSSGSGHNATSRLSSTHKSNQDKRPISSVFGDRAHKQPKGEGVESRLKAHLAGGQSRSQPQPQAQSNPKHQVAASEAQSQIVPAVPTTINVYKPAHNFKQNQTHGANSLLGKNPRFVDDLIPAMMSQTSSDWSKLAPTGTPSIAVTTTTATPMTTTTTTSTTTTTTTTTTTPAPTVRFRSSGGGGGSRHSSTGRWSTSSRKPAQFDYADIERYNVAASNLHHLQSTTSSAPEESAFPTSRGHNWNDYATSSSTAATIIRLPAIELNRLATDHQQQVATTSEPPPTILNTGSPPPIYHQDHNSRMSVSSIYRLESQSTSRPLSSSSRHSTFGHYQPTTEPATSMPTNTLVYSQPISTIRTTSQPPTSSSIESSAPIGVSDDPFPATSTGQPPVTPTTTTRMAATVRIVDSLPKARISQSPTVTTTLKPIIQSVTFPSSSRNDYITTTHLGGTSNTSVVELIGSNSSQQVAISITRDSSKLNGSTAQILQTTPQQQHPTDVPKSISSTTAQTTTSSDLMTKHKQIQASQAQQTFVTNDVPHSTSPSTRVSTNSLTNLITKDSFSGANDGRSSMSQATSGSSSNRRQSRDDSSGGSSTTTTTSETPTRIIKPITSATTTAEGAETVEAKTLGVASNFLPHAPRFLSRIIKLEDFDQFALILAGALCIVLLVLAIITSCICYHSSCGNQPNATSIGVKSRRSAMNASRLSSLSSGESHLGPMTATMRSTRSNGCFSRSIEFFCCLANTRSHKRVTPMRSLILQDDDSSSGDSSQGLNRSTGKSMLLAANESLIRGSQDPLLFGSAGILQSTVSRSQKQQLATGTGIRLFRQPKNSTTTNGKSKNKKSKEREKEKARSIYAFDNEIGEELSTGPLDHADGVRLHCHAHAADQEYFVGVTNQTLKKQQHQHQLKKQQQQVPIAIIAGSSSNLDRPNLLSSRRHFGEDNLDQEGWIRGNGGQDSPDSCDSDKSCSPGANKNNRYNISDAHRTYLSSATKAASQIQASRYVTTATSDRDNIHHLAPDLRSGLLKTIESNGWRRSRGEQHDHNRNRHHRHHYHSQSHLDYTDDTSRLSSDKSTTDDSRAPLSNTLSRGGRRQEYRTANFPPTSAQYRQHSTLRNISTVKSFKAQISRSQSIGRLPEVDLCNEVKHHQLQFMEPSPTNDTRCNEDYLNSELVPVSAEEDWPEPYVDPADQCIVGGGSVISVNDQQSRHSIGRRNLKPHLDNSSSSRIHHNKQQQQLLDTLRDTGSNGDTLHRSSGSSGDSSAASQQCLNPNRTYEDAYQANWNTINRATATGARQQVGASSARRRQQQIQAPGTSTLVRNKSNPSLEGSPLTGATSWLRWNQQPSSDHAHLHQNYQEELYNNNHLSHNHQLQKHQRQSSMSMSSSWHQENQVDAMYIAAATSQQKQNRQQR